MTAYSTNYLFIIAVALNGITTILEDKTVYEDGRPQDINDLMNENGLDTLGYIHEYVEGDKQAGIYDVQLTVDWAKSEDTSNGPGEWDFEIRLEIINQLVWTTGDIAPR